MPTMKQSRPDKAIKDINKQVDQVQKYIVALNHMKDDTIMKLEKEKKSLRRQIQMGMRVSRTSADITAQIKYVSSEHGHILKKLLEKYEQVKQVKTEAELLNDIIHELDMEIAQIQDQHNDRVFDLEQKQEELLGYVTEIEKLKLIFDAITFKLFTVEEVQANRMKEFDKKRADILNNPKLTEDQRAAALARVDREKYKAMADNDEILLSLKEQKRNIETETARKIAGASESLDTLQKEQHLLQKQLETHKVLGKIDDLLGQPLDEHDPADFDKRQQDLKNAIDDLKKMLENASPSQAELIRNKIKMLEDMANAMREKNLLDSLADKGFYISPSGHLRTLSGRLVSMDEAIKMGLISPKDKLLLAKMLLKKQDEAVSEKGSVASSKVSEDSHISSEDVGYLKKTIGKPLALALAEVTTKKPRDPIHYLAHWLIKYRYNKEVQEAKEMEIEELCAERTRIAQEMLHKMLEDEAARAILYMIEKAEDIALKKQIDAELRRIAEEAAMAEEEEEAYDSEARDVMGVYNGPPINQNVAHT